MDIIPQNRGFLQVGISNPVELFIQDSGNVQLAPMRSLTFVQQQALFLYEVGLNVFPQPLQQKMGYPWKRLQYTRLNGQDGALNVQQLFAGQCNLAVMCGHTSGNLFVIDCETWESFQFHLNQLRRRNIPVWAVTTQRGGHLYLRAREGEVHNIPSGILAGAEIRARNAYVLGPGSLHPLGTAYRWLMRMGEQVPVVSIQEINWLRNQEGQVVHLRADKARLQPSERGARYISPYSKLTRATRQYILEGYAIPQGERNQRLFAAACDLCANQYSEAEARQLLSPQARLSGLPLFEIDKTIASAYSRPRTPARNQSAPARTATPLVLSRQWQYALLSIANRPYEGRNANSLRALLLAFVERSRVSMNEQGVFRASIRELAELARMGTATVQRLLQFLAEQNKPLLLKVGVDEMSGATLWRWSKVTLEQGKRLEIHQPEQASLRPWLLFAQALFSLDACESGGLGKGAAFLFQIMKHEKRAYMPSKWVSIAGMSLSQVNYALAKLRQFELIERSKEGWSAVDISNQQLEKRVTERYPATVRRRLARQRRFMRERQHFVSKLLHLSRLKREKELYNNLEEHPPPNYNWDIYEKELLNDSFCWIGLQAGVCVILPDGRYARWINLPRLEIEINYTKFK